ncbi:Isopentenyl phosphate kinase [Gracilariopsis chorda]|uniref:Isopentenyl phosphate kinase n=1 Tax=Gracilariopsis chorda TaxID=448386 RepID=A0A2V3IPB7_9FLOR|nr:Isopentenyl phosphate kinase [Gracilariopsis chorda]|eukprot:PXF43903.1 Isopentenyl phosphate kinase [Gracilariopsis chorda]
MPPSTQSEQLAPPPLPLLPVTQQPPTSSPPPVELIVKLGGSALTNKQKRATLDAPRFEASIQLMSTLYHAGVGFILVHGAGSFGHMEATHYQIRNGKATPLAMSATHAAVTQLNSTIVTALIQRGVPAVGVSPLLVPTRVRNEFVATLLDRAHIPVLHGDICYGADGRTAILSGDTLVSTLCAAFDCVRRVVFLCDVPGLLSRPPSQSQPAHLVRRVLVNERGDVKLDTEIQTTQAAHDVSGGIMAKLMAAAKSVAQGGGRVTAFIAGVSSEGAQQALLWRPERGMTSSCTRISYEIAGGGGGNEPESSASMPRRRGWFRAARDDALR